MITANELALRNELIVAAHWAREQLRRADIGSRMTLEVEITGDVQTGELRLTYKFDTPNLSAIVRGNNLVEVVMEGLRRLGWQKHNDGYLLEAPEAAAPPASEDIF